MEVQVKTLALLAIAAIAAIGLGMPSAFAAPMSEADQVYEDALGGLVVPSMIMRKAKCSIEIAIPPS